ncbi:M12 family metallo-peptidase [Nocardioides sp. SYSU D00065]|uniref:M12 family metallo-peptidase n=1 Tax=Nocardioides sp. SYSU D00065 TaxID=2817378 RepID=UPI001B32E60D|nr:M12 family metallo-peptidase [Nocardioides sp. SYSU D00065]
MPNHKTMASIAGLCAVALTATTAPAITASAAPTGRDEAVELLSAPTPDDRTGRLPGASEDERTRAVELDTDALGDAAVGDRVSLALFDDTTLTAVIEDRSTADGVTSWRGGVEGVDGTFSAVEVDGTMHLNITSSARGTFEVSSTRTGDYVVSEAGTPPGSEYDAIEPTPPAGEDGLGHGTQRRAPRDPSAALGPASLRDAPETIDVAIVYPALLATQMGQAAMEAQFAQGIAQTNEAFANSGVATRVRLVGTRQLAAPQSPVLEANLQALRAPGDGVFDEAQALREETHADLVSLWLANSVPGGEACGMAYLGGTNPARDAEWAAWSVVYAANCATDFRVFAHELGHNFSADHDAGAKFPPSGGKPYARGYVDVPARTITVMSYYDQCVAAGVNCTRIGYFSSPNVVAAGRPQGTAATNNVQAINEQLAAVASYRQSQIYPGAASVTGRARFKGTAKATSTEWAPAVSLSYQWLLDGAPVPGATRATYDLARRDIGKTLSVQVTGSAPYYSSVTTVSAPVVVGKALFKTKRPKLRGLPRVGRVLSVSVKGWKPKPAKKSVKVRYQWLRNGKKIKGAKGATYRVRPKDRGKKISVKVIAKAKDYESAKRSSKKVKIRR